MGLQAHDLVYEFALEIIGFNRVVSNIYLILSAAIAPFLFRVNRKIFIAAFKKKLAVRPSHTASQA